MYQLTEKHHLVKGLDPVADAFAGTVYSDVVNMANFAHLTAIISKGVGATGTSTVTVEACDNANGDNPVAIPFRYRINTTGDTWGELLNATAAGFATTAGSSQRYAVEVDSEEMASSDKAWLRIKAVEVVDSPVLGGIDFILSQPRFAAPFETAIA